MGLSLSVWKSMPIGIGEIFSRASEPSQFWANQYTTLGLSRRARASDRNSDGVLLSESPVTTTNLAVMRGSTCLTNDFSHESRTHSSSPSWTSLKIFGSEIRLSGSAEETNAPANVE